MKSLTYLAIDVGCIFFPLLFSFTKWFPFWRHFKKFALANLIVTSFFIIWDILFTAKGVWGFNPDYLTGIYFINLPIEEVLFFICIPYACVFSFFTIYRYLPLQRLGNLHHWIASGLLIINILAAIFSYPKLYPFTTSVLVSLLLIFVLYRKLNMTGIYLAYVFVFPFFLLSNGLLTGSFLDSPVVWYNDAENLGIRIYTIPIEDTMYGFLMICLNIILSFYMVIEDAALSLKKLPVVK